ncbi:MAG: SET domain-containing protein-lysine N-methyltransferase [Chrysiogenales bacterium]|nr:MAG: SET domain-containing protein-lysine N-methyltransferase [Chrysiogenales bacterium]
MLLVKTRVRDAYRGDVHIGFGLFADQFIPKGTIIWKFNPLIDRVISRYDLASFSDIELHFLETYTYREGENLILCSDDAKYVNHSHTPNTDNFENEEGSVTVANTDINTGDEITSDYSHFADDSQDGAVDAYL